MFVVYTLCSVLLLCFPFVTHAQLQRQPASQHTLLQYGSAQSTQTFLLSVASPLESLATVTLHTEHDHILTSHQLLFTRISPRAYNLTVQLFFDGLPGDVHYSLVASTTIASTQQQHNYNATASHSVYGVVYYEMRASQRHIVSGDDAHEIVFPSFTTPDAPPRQLLAVAHAPPHVALNASAFVRAAHGTLPSALLSASRVRASEHGASIAPHAFRVGAALVTLEFGALQLHGETFETVLRVRVPDVPAPPPVLASVADVEARVHANGSAHFSLRMFNVLGAQQLVATVGAHMLFDGEVQHALQQQNEYVVRFASRGSVREGTFPLAVRVAGGDARGGDAAREVVMLRELRVRVVRAVGAETLVVGGAGGGVALVAGVSIAAVVFAVATVGAVAAAVVWSRRRSERAEAAAHGGAPMVAEHVGGFGIARDVYGRGSIDV